MITHTYNPSARDAEAGGSHKVEVSLGYAGRLFLKTKQKIYYKTYIFKSTKIIGFAVKHTKRSFNVNF